MVCLELRSISDCHFAMGVSLLGWLYNGHTLKLNDNFEILPRLELCDVIMLQWKKKLESTSNSSFVTSIYILIYYLQTYQIILTRIKFCMI